MNGCVSPLGKALKQPAVVPQVVLNLGGGSGGSDLGTVREQPTAVGKRSSAEGRVYLLTTLFTPPCLPS